MGGLLDCADQRASRADDQLVRSDDARALLLEKMTVDGDAPGTLDLTIRENTGFADDELGSFAERDRALFEQALDFDRCALVELERRVAKHVAAAEVSAIGDTLARLDGTRPAEQCRNLVGGDAAAAGGLCAGL